MRPFFTYYGSKWRAAPRYPAPLHDLIVEPFAGSAGYSVRHYERDVMLIERDPIIAGIWQYLINAESEEILSLPLCGEGWDTTDDLIGSIPSGAISLIGMWLNKGVSIPGKRPSKWVRAGTHPGSVWGAPIRQRIADQVSLIRHWRIINGDYSDCPNVDATWFIDPPYEDAGRHYRMGSAQIDYGALAEWCKGRNGRAVVCEAEGATWLPFESFGNVKGTKRTASEVIWTND